MADFLNKIFDFFELCKDLIVSTIEGLLTFASALATITTSSTFVGIWMPAGIAAIVTAVFVLVIILRLVGR